ncbi:hypothetical protein ACIBCN_19790 [Nocardia sp. NPDC051052]|uniref:hypothetical protein n=1 Tax=Nocardia sp. NPDC051052 TaxID=3364322 RepID=UPI0037923EC6
MGKKKPAKPTAPEVNGQDPANPIKVPKPGQSDDSGKSTASDAPDWVKNSPYRPYVGEDGKTFAKRVLDAVYGPGNYKTGADTEYSKMQKWADRKFVDPPKPELTQVKH